MGTPFETQDCADICGWTGGAALACAVAVFACIAVAPTAQGESPEIPVEAQSARTLPATQVGKASYYADHLAGRKMANGERMDPESNIAASRTLPLGTKALVTNLENGKSAMVEIQDRGPYVAGRIIDLTPSTAVQLDMEERGVVRVEVRPVELPPAQAGQRTANR